MPGSPKKAKALSHPPVKVMVKAAISNMKDRKGSSLSAIKKYIAGTYHVDAEALAPFIKQFLRRASTDGTLKHTKGTGAAGSFKIGAVAKKVTPKKAKKPKSAKKAKKAKSPKKVKKPKSPKKKSRTKKGSKKTKKPKAAKTSKTSISKRKSPKKAKKPKAKKTKKSKAKKTTKKSKK